MASEDYRDDIKISDEILRQLADAYRKIRNTMRFLLGNLFDFDPAANGVPYERMEELDRWALAQFERLKRRVVKAYEAFEFHTVFHGLYQFCTVTLSALYLDILKDRLYTELADSPARRSAQTVLYRIADGLLRLMAPVMSFTAAEAWHFLPVSSDREAEVVLATFPALDDDCLDDVLLAKWDGLLVVRAEITKALELARQDKVIGHPLEAAVSVKATDKAAATARRKLAAFENRGYCFVPCQGG